MGRRFAYIAVPFENFFGGYVRAVVEERRIVEDRLEILWDLVKVLED